MDKQRKWLLEMKSTPGEDAMRIVEMTIQHLEYYIKLVDKVAEEFEKIHSNFERSTTVNKVLSNSIAFSREIICERKSQSMKQISMFY